MIGLQLARHFLESDGGFIAAREGVGFEALDGILERQTHGDALFGTSGESGIVFHSGSSEVYADGQIRLFREVELIAYPLGLFRVIIDTIPSVRIAFSVQEWTFAELLRPVALVCTVGLQEFGRFTVLDLFLREFRTLLWLAAGVEVVAVVERGLGSKGVAAFVAGVVRTDVKTVVQGAGADLVTYKAAHCFLGSIRHGGDAAFDGAIGDREPGILVIKQNHTCR